MTRPASDAMLTLLNQHIEALDAGHALTDVARLAADLDAIRRLASANGFGAVTAVIHAIEAALGRGERGPAVANGLALLRDAAGCGDDLHHSAALAAACRLRIVG